jgi:Zn-dependent protease/CBS domain-containing protein
MRWSFKIARVAGTEVKIHVTFLLLLAWIGIAYYVQGGLAAAVNGIVFISLIFACVLLHEFGHALAARRYGIPTPDITLLPIGGVARLQRMPERPRQEFVVAVAGPLVNVAIAGGLFLVMQQITGLSPLMELQNPEAGLLSKLAWVNVALVVFNLIPAFPMDGGRVLRALLATRLSYAKATQIAAGVGQGIAFLFGFAGLFFNPLLIFIALFVYLGASQEAALAQMKDLAHGLPVSEAMVTRLSTLRADATVDAAAEAVVRTMQHEIPVLDAQDEVLGIVTRDDVIKALKRGEGSASVQGIMHRDIPTVRAEVPFDHAFRLLEEHQAPALFVVDDEGRPIGLVTPESVGEMMMLRGSRSDDQLTEWRERHRAMEAVPEGETPRPKMEREPPS